MSPVIQSRRYTASEYLALDRNAVCKNEFFDGEILPIPGETVHRSRIIINLISGLNDALSESRCRVFNHQMRVGIPETGYYTYPDASVVGAKPEFEDLRQDTLLNPILIIEVAGDSPEDGSRETRFEHYKAMPHLREYVLISQTRPLITIWRRMPADRWEVLETAGLGSYLSLISVGSALPLARLYCKVSFS